jgi:hypothetical protein
MPSAVTVAALCAEHRGELCAYLKRTFGAGSSKGAKTFAIRELFSKINFG